MDLLKQCQKWFEQEEEQKVIDALEAIPAEERTPELDSELAKAYIAVAHIGEREPFERALELLAPHEEYFAGDHCWNYRIASAYYFLDEEGPALRYFEKALKARPGDKDTQEYIDDCRRRLSLPRLKRTSVKGRRNRGQPLLRLRGRCVKSWTPTKCTSAAKNWLKNAGMHSRRPCAILPLSWASMAKSMN